MTLFLLLVAAALAAQLNLNVGTRQLTVGETVPLELQIVDGAAAGVPEIPVGSGLSLDYQGQSQSRVVVNFRSTRITSYSYGLTALAEGTWTVGPVKLQSADESLTAPAVTITVLPRSQDAEEARAVTAALSDADPWLGQVVVYQFRFRHKGEVLDARWTPPAFEGFVKEQSAETAQRETPLLQDGERYTVQEIDVPLVAAGAGARNIGPAMLAVQVPAPSRRDRRGDPFADSPFRSFRDVINETLTADGIPVTVRPLPEQGRPADFSGLVGSFTMKVEPSATSVKLGDSVTVEVVLEGDGSLAGFKLPAPAADAGWRAYDDAPVVEAAVVDGRYRARAVFRRAIVPERVGPLTVPGLRIPVFDPQSGSYTVVEGAPLSLEVAPGEADAGEITSFAGSSGAAQKAVASVGEDILPAPGEARVRDRAAGGGFGLYLLPPLVPALGLLLLELGRALRGRAVDPWEALQAGLGRLPAEDAPRIAALEAIFREAAALRLGRSAAGLDRTAVATLGEDARALYADLEAARYGGQRVQDLEPRVRAFVARRSS